MRICLILEGCYPYVTGGVSSWVHQYMQAMPEHEFVIWAIGANSADRGKFRYRLPDNVAQIREIFLDEALSARFEKQKHVFSEAELSELKHFINCRNPRWETLFDLYQEKKVSPAAFLMSQDFLDLITQICREEYPYTAFSALFHTVRSMMLPVLWLLASEVPQADLYHSIATGYAGILARLGSHLYGVPYLLTEHGIYTREREAEIIRAKWVLPTFKRMWIRFFYMLSEGAYEKAVLITSLFERARLSQIDMGCDPHRCRCIANGIHFARFAGIPSKRENGSVDIGAVLRIAPIKDVKTMICAFADLKKRVSNVRLHICGPEDDPEYAKECYDLTEQLGVSDVLFPGTVDVIPYMERFDFTVLTSISEGQPLSVLESFAAGRPCVTTDVGCCRELMEGLPGDTLGAAGICVPPMHREAVCDAMEYLATHPQERRQMACAAKRRAELYFCHGDMIRNYREAYGEVLRRWQA